MKIAYMTASNPYSNQSQRKVSLYPMHVERDDYNGYPIPGCIARPTCLLSALISWSGPPGLGLCEGLKTFPRKNT